MTRFKSLGFSDFDVRTKLRDRFQHELRSIPLIAYRDLEQPELNDISVLHLLQDTQIPTPEIHIIGGLPAQS